MLLELIKLNHMMRSNPVRFGLPVDPKCHKCGKPLKDDCPCNAPKDK